MILRSGLALATIALSVIAYPAAAQRIYYEAQAVPPARVEVVPDAQPYVYPPGHWEDRGGVHVWVNGPYVVERPQMYWVPGRWLHEPDGRWIFEDGHWER
jgi:hypothetical protein